MVTATGAVTGCVLGCDGFMTGSNTNPSQPFANPQQPVTPVTTSGNGPATRHKITVINDLVTGVTGWSYVSALARVVTKTLYALSSYKGKQPVTPVTNPAQNTQNRRSNPNDGLPTDPSHTRHDPAQAQR